MRLSGFLHPAAALTLMTALLAGCGGERAPTAPSGPLGGPAPTDELEISSAIAGAPEWVEESVFALPEPTILDERLEGPSALIHPLRYWRTISHVELRREIAFADSDSVGRPTVAIVTLHKHLAGTFNILAGAPARDLTSLDSARIVRKPLRDHWVRRILLQRVRLNSDLGFDRPRWRIAAISGVRVSARVPDGVPATRIERVRIQTADHDLTISDPLALVRLRGILRLEPGTPVRVTVTTRNARDIVVLLHRGPALPFRPNGDGTFTAEWRVPPLPGHHHLGVNALSRGTLFDDRAPYNSDAWILPLAVTPARLADYVP